MTVLPLVIVTGFGPFGEHKVNASSEAVSELQRLWESDLNRRSYNLIAQHIPVSYNVVSDVVPSLWQEHSPALIIHTGVHDGTSKLLLEAYAYNEPHVLRDIDGCVPDRGCCKASGSACLKTRFNLETVTKAVIEQSGLDVDVSHDPGRYLCNYCYYQSLCVSAHVLFIHVPPLGPTYTKSALATLLDMIIKQLLRQIDQNEPVDETSIEQITPQRMAAT